MEGCCSGGVLAVVEGWRGAASNGGGLAAVEGCWEPAINMLY